MNSIYKTQMCRNCGMPHHDLPAMSPNLTFWEHRNDRWCIRATAISLEQLQERVAALESNLDKLEEAHIVI